MGVVDTDVDVHPADDKLASHLLVVRGQPYVPRLLGGFLLGPSGEGVRGGGDDGGSILADYLRQAGSKASQVHSRLG